MTNFWIMCLYLTTSLVVPSCTVFIFTIVSFLGAKCLPNFVYKICHAFLFFIQFRLFLKNFNCCCVFSFTRSKKSSSLGLALYFPHVHVLYFPIYFFLRECIQHSRMMCFSHKRKKLLTIFCWLTAECQSLQAHVSFCHKPVTLASYACRTNVTD